MTASIHTACVRASQALLPAPPGRIADASASTASRSGGSDETAGNVDAVEVGMQIGKSVGTIPTDLLLVGRALGLLDGITKQLDPSMDTLEIVAHYAE